MLSERSRMVTDKEAVGLDNEFYEALVNKLIVRITVFADHFTVVFKSGITIEIEA